MSKRKETKAEEPKQSAPETWEPMPILLGQTIQIWCTPSVEAAAPRCPPKWVPEYDANGQRIASRACPDRPGCVHVHFVGPRAKR